MALYGWRMEAGTFNSKAQQIPSLHAYRNPSSSRGKEKREAFVKQLEELRIQV